MNNKKLFAALMAIAIVNPDGFTVDAKTLQPITSGFAVAVAETQNSFGRDGLNRVINHVTNNPKINAFGGWLNSSNNQFYWDGTIIINDLSEAIRIARANGQIAIFDLDNLQEITIK